ncbi:amidohydrolase [Nocardioides mangrovicus]|uniref:Amidohydrolase n=1 Tax=Nocardioides mangrovicus TaxID=2478913 RepID=A0A3L8P4E2_9ACTN|nr:amidohydrolase family protein [Nocardioides mangrovicus]RLV50276.1 amidohydrolase [Nocardioides mangrovicus]
MLLTHVELDGALIDARVLDAAVVEAGRLQPRAGEEVLDGRGGALIRGLHDHHLHLYALAADRGSVDCSSGLAALTGARPGSDGWVRGVRARESVDRAVLDALVPDRPVRVQHRGGSLWMLNSAALARVRLDGSDDVERDEDGAPSGRLWRYDARLRAALPTTPPDLGPVLAELTSYGITSVTDATPGLDAGVVSHLAGLDLPVAALGDPAGAAPWKLLLRDHDLVSFDDLLETVRRRRPRPVAVHCVTRESLLLTLAVLDEVGRVPGDRIEHGAVVPDPAALRGLVVVTQPAFVTTRGEDYRRDVEPDDLPHLYRYRSLLDAGVPVLPSSDAPYGPVDPWVVMRAARDRVLGRPERVDAATVLRGYQHGGSGLVLLRTGLSEALDALDSAVVRASWSVPRRPAGNSTPGR